MQQAEQELEDKFQSDEEQFLDQRTNISHVGFNNLRKHPTNRSQASSVETKSTSRLKPLTRLFLVNRGTESDKYMDRYDDKIPLDTPWAQQTTKDKSSKLLNFPKKRSRLRLNSYNPETELSAPSIGNTEHSTAKSRFVHLDDKGPKNLTSPVSLHQIFHRSHSANIGSISNDAHHKAGLSLSSQNSNSFIKDSKKAAQFRFTNPSFLWNVTENSIEGNTFQGLHKKYLVSADNYIPHKAKVSLDSTKSESGPNPEALDLSQRNDGDVFDLLFILTQRLFQHESQHEGAPSVGEGTLENLSSFVRDNIVAKLRASEKRNTENELLGLGSRYGLTITSESNNIDQQNEEQGDEMLDSKQRELTQSIQNFFSKGCENLKDLIDSHFFSKRNLNMDFAKEEFHLKILEELWLKLLVSWDHFNLNVRFFFLQVFEPLQEYFDQSALSGKDSYKSPNIESILMTSFKDKVISIYLQERVTLFASSPGNTKLRSQEELFLRSEKVWKRVTNCFGLLTSYDCFDIPELKDEGATRILLSHDFMIG